jgi:hypothetical protein
VTIQASALQEQCVAVITKMVGVGTILASTELLHLKKELSAGGLFSWANARTRFPFALRHGTIVLFDAVCGYPQYLYLVVLQALCGVALLFSTLPSLKLFLLLAILFVHLATMLRSNGTDGADQMQTILLISLACYYASPDPMVRKAAVWFVALQAILAYFTAGVSKLWSDEWLKGTMLRKSLVHGLGREAFNKWLPKGARENQLLCLSVVALECSFPLVIVAWPIMCLAILGAGVLLHLTNAFALGFPRFLFTFVAAYPAIVSFTCDVQPTLRAHFG